MCNQQQTVTVDTVQHFGVHRLGACVDVDVAQCNSCNFRRRDCLELVHAVVTLLAVLQTVAMQKVMSKFGVMEVCRTGRISLKRGEELLEQIRAPTERAVHHRRSSE